MSWWFEHEGKRNFERIMAWREICRKKRLSARIKGDYGRQLSQGYASVSFIVSTMSYIILFLYTVNVEVYYIIS